MSHALIIGGTGMLSGVSRHLCEEYKTVSVIGRNPHRFNSLLRETAHLPGNVNPLQLDYTDSANLVENLNTSIERYGNISLVVSWIHSTAPEAPFLVAKEIDKYGKQFRFFEILGSAYGNPANKSKRNSGIEEGSTLEDFNKLVNVRYREIILGFVIEGNGSRWLTNDEISNGVIKAVETDIENSVIGTVEPWDKKP